MGRIRYNTDILVEGISIITLFIVSSFLIILLYESSDGHEIIRWQIEDKVIDFQQDSNMTMITDYCSYFRDPLGKISCIHNFVANSGYFIYNQSKDIKDPEELLASGGDCKSWSAFYRTALTKLNISNKDVYLDSHIFTIAQTDSFYCVLDQKTMECIAYKG